jgi:uncharacterized coiled-coil DUF342 family protein
VRWLIERRLVDVSARIKQTRAELQVVEEQMQHWAHEADDARIRSLVSETPLAGAQHREVQKSADGMAKAHEALLRRIAELRAQQDELLDKLGEG